MIPSVAAQIKELEVQRALVAAEVVARVDAPLTTLTQVLISKPGVGTKSATILLTAGEFSSFLTQATWLLRRSPKSPDALAPRGVGNSLTTLARNN